MIIYHKIRPYFPNFGNHTPKNKCLQNNLALMEDGKIGRWGEEVGRGNWECGLRPGGVIGAYAPEGRRNKKGRGGVEGGIGNAEC
jgi:hypothetical protein